MLEYGLTGRRVEVGLTAITMEWDGEKENVLVTRDITEKLETSKRLEESQTRYSRLIDASPDAIRVHVDGLIVFANAAAATLFGAASAEDFLDLNGKIFFPRRRQVTAHRSESRP